MQMQIHSSSSLSIHTTLFVLYYKKCLSDIIQLLYMHMFIVRNFATLQFLTTQLCVEGLMSYLCYLYLFTYSESNTILIYHGSLIRSKNCSPFAKTWVYHQVFSGIRVADIFYFSVLCFVCSLFCVLCLMLPVSLDCLLWIVHSVFSSVYIYIYAATRAFTAHITVYVYTYNCVRLHV